MREGLLYYLWSLLRLISKGAARLIYGLYLRPFYFLTDSGSLRFLTQSEHRVGLLEYMPTYTESRGGGDAIVIGVLGNFAV
jgi:hypothetical protein